MTIPIGIGKRIIQCLLAIASGAITSIMYLFFISEYCITIYEACLPDRDNYYSQIARLPIALPAVVFIIGNIIIFFGLKKRYKAYAYTYILLTGLISLLSLIFIKTNQIIGL